MRLVISLLAMGLLSGGAYAEDSKAKIDDAVAKIEAAMKQSADKSIEEKAPTEDSTMKVEESAEKVADSVSESSEAKSVSEPTETKSETVVSEDKAMIGESQATESVVKSAEEAEAEDAVTVIETTAIALRGKPHYPPEFTNFDYVDADAPTGGSVKDWARGTFDNFNPYAQRGDAAKDASKINDSIMTSSHDDLSAYYPLIAEKISYNSELVIFWQFYQSKTALL